MRTPPPIVERARESGQLAINEIYLAIQGETTFAGLPCVLVRLTGCPLRCAWCDTRHSFAEGELRTVEDVAHEALAHGVPHIMVTGGEPLWQPTVHDLMARLADAGREVLLETCGAVDYRQVDPRVHRIVDLKAPGSGEANANLLECLDDLRPTDELKVVIADRADYEWARAQVLGRGLADRCPVLFSPILDRLEGSALAEWILEDRLPVRLQVQLHKLLWPPDAGV